MEFGLLRPLEVFDGKRKLPLGGANQRGLLADLLIHANEVVSVDRLIDDLLGEAPPDMAVNALQTYMSQLRKVIEPERQSGGPGAFCRRSRPATF